MGALLVAKHVSSPLALAMLFPIQQREWQAKIVLKPSCVSARLWDAAMFTGFLYV